MTQVLILNSGTGSRMREFTKTKPKCLVEINEEETILGRQLEIFKDFGLENILITTGPFADQVEEHLKKIGWKKPVKLINNPHYATTNYIYSLILTGDYIMGKNSSEIILLHGDLVFERPVLRQLLEAKNKDQVLTNPTVELPAKDFKALIKRGLVKKIGVDLFGEDCVFLIPFYRLSAKTFSAWLEEMKRFQTRGLLKVYAENALNNLLSGIALYPVELKDEFCMEIDDGDDLEQAKQYFAGMREG